MIPVFSTTVSCVIIKFVREIPQMLLMKRSVRDGGHWNHLTGGIESNETGIEAIVREIFEETRLTPIRLYNGEYIEQFYQPAKNRILLMPLFVAEVSPMDDVVLNEEHTEFRWLGLDQVLELVNYDQQKAVYHHVWRLFVNNEVNKKLNVPFEPHPLHN